MKCQNFILLTPARAITMKDNTIGVTKTTADSYMKNIRAKLDVSNLAQLMAKYYEWKYKGN